ncbi:glycosyltransferase [Glaciimonas sp. GNP009]
MAHIRDWANGADKNLTQPAFVTTHAVRPLRWAEYDRDRAEEGGNTDDPSLVLINTGGNLGFAGGNNVGIRYALAHDYDFIWLLNNDTVVNASSLVALLSRMLADSKIGICGSTLAYFDAPDTVQALGGSRFDFKRGIGAHLGLGEELSVPRNQKLIEQSLDYVVGASMMVSRAFLKDVGLMCEDYFLYFEEIDWAMRAKGKFILAWAPESVVLHKEGGTIGSSHRSRPSTTSLFYLYRNRLRFAHRHTPEHYWSVWRSVGYEAAVYLKRCDFEAAKIIFCSLITACSFTKRTP